MKNQLPTCLLITENPSIRSFAKKYLDPHYFIIESTKRRDIIDTVRHATLDFILIDGNIENCLPICKEIRKTLFLTPTPILLITGRLKKTFRDEAIDAGVTDFLSDQLDPEELETRIASAYKNLTIREKTDDLSVAIRPPKEGISSSNIKNKVLLHDHSVRLLNSSKTTQKSNILLLIQIDRVEALQTELGYSVVDALFLSLADFINRYLKKDDSLFTSSENRLIVLLNNTQISQAKSFAETIRKKVGQHIFHTTKGDQKITISIAYSNLEAPESSFEKMVETSIKALKAQSSVNFIIKIETP